MKKILILILILINATFVKSQAFCTELSSQNLPEIILGEFGDPPSNVTGKHVKIRSNWIFDHDVKFEQCFIEFEGNFIGAVWSLI
jgi:hypothetical protein